MFKSAKEKHGENILEQDLKLMILLTGGAGDFGISIQVTLFEHVHSNRKTKPACTCYCTKMMRTD